MLFTILDILFKEVSYGVRKEDNKEGSSEEEDNQEKVTW